MYYLLGQPTPEHPCRWIGEEPYIEGVNFRLGKRITVPVPQPLKFALEPLDALAPDHGPNWPPIFNENALLYRSDFIDALRSYGVDNFDLYDAEIYDPDNAEIRKDYQVVNIIGVLSVANMQLSNATVHDGVPLMDVDFESLVLDESEARGLLMFRLVESTNAILIREDLKSFLESKGFVDVTFDDPRTSAV